MVQMPTGIGKLHSLASVIHEHLQERQRQSVWIATHRRELVEQIGRYGGAVRHTERGGIGLFLPMAVTPLGGCGK